MKDMSSEELISYRDDIREFMSVGNKEDAELYNKVSDELLSRLKSGERAVKAMDELDCTCHCFDCMEIIAKYKSETQEARKC